MATAEVVPAGSQDTQPRISKRRPFDWFKRLTHRKDTSEKSQNTTGNQSGNAKSKKNGKNNNPYPESGLIKRQHSQGSKSEGNLSFATPASQPGDDDASYGSLPRPSKDAVKDKNKATSNNSAAPTVATDAADTIHSDAGHSKAFTNTTGAGGLSSITDGVHGGGEGSTFSSPNESAQSLTTTLTTIQSQNAGQHTQHTNATGGPGAAGQHASQTTSAAHFAGSSTVASALPPHMQTGMPGSSSNLLTDNASIMTLASSSKRRRRSMDTDASVRALAPASMYGGSRESLPLSVLSGNTGETPTTTAPGTSAGVHATQSRPSISGPERASVYSAQGGVTAPALASERNSYYATSHLKKRNLAEDAKSVSSVAGIYPKSEYDARSINEIRSGVDVPVGGGGKDYEPSFRTGGGARGYEGSVRSSAFGHGRNDSIPGSIGGSQVNSPLLKEGRQASTTGGMSRRSSDFADLEDKAREVEEGEADKVAAAGENTAARHSVDDSRLKTEEYGKTDGKTSFDSDRMAQKSEKQITSALDGRVDHG